jgi:ssDNA-binding Zn-finger/Zn-ribbon topoisomerase 1
MGFAIPLYYLGVVGMQQRVICHGCSHILYEGAELKPPDEIITQTGGKCPKCGRKLSLLPLEVEVKPVSKR